MIQLELPLFDRGGYPEPKEPGLYLRLFHGRAEPNEHLDDWGFDGPVIGPLEFMHTTYAFHVKLGFVNPEKARAFKLDPRFPELIAHEDLLVHDGKYYGDWSAYVHA
jgi:hypothetical protein